MFSAWLKMRNGSDLKNKLAIYKSDCVSNKIFYHIGIKIRIFVYVLIKNMI